MINEPEPDARAANVEDPPPEIEAVLMAVWRRVMEEGCGPEMSIIEAAAVLGASVSSVRRRVAAGLIPAYRDDHGRIRIVPRLLPPAVQTEGDAKAPAATTITARLMEELKSTKAQLHRVVREHAGLQKDKAAVEQSLEHTKDELSAMWRLLCARTSTATRRTEAKKGSADVVPMRLDESKIQSQITAVRKLAKRRKWPWAFVG